jgi:NADPH:quinone reductase-like Zn-dependent oxidoreductase
VRRVSDASIATARALWITAKARAEIRSEQLPSLAADEVRVQASYSGVSRGTEALIYRHAVPEHERERMRAPHQAGSLPGPVKYGYANVGRVIAGSEPLLGRKVFCLYPHQSVYNVTASAVVPLPDAVPEARAVLAANMETAVNALWDVTPRIGERIAVVGAGVVGALCAYLAARTPGCEVWLIDLHADRAELAAKLGAHFALPDATPRGLDLVIHASATAAGLALALASAADESTVLELSWYGDTLVPVPLGAAFHAGRLSLRSSQVGQVALPMRGRRSLRERLTLALGLLADPVLDCLISGECELAELPQRLPELLGPNSRALCQRVRYA